MNSISNSVINNQMQLAAENGRVQTQPPISGTDKAEQAFQEFYAGTFYRLMLKALRKSQGEMAYFDGGQAERIFQSQLDEQIVQNLSEHHGRDLAAPLYEQYLRTHSPTHATTQTSPPHTAQTRQQQPVVFDRQA